MPLIIKYRYITLFNIFSYIINLTRITHPGFGCRYLPSVLIRKLIKSFTGVHFYLHGNYKFILECEVLGAKEIGDHFAIYTYREALRCTR